MKAIVNQTNIGTVSTAAALRKLPEDGIERIWTSPTLRYHPALFFIIVITIFITLLHGFGFSDFSHWTRFSSRSKSVQLTPVTPPPQWMGIVTPRSKPQTADLHIPRT